MIFLNQPLTEQIILKKDGIIKHKFKTESATRTLVQGVCNCNCDLVITEAT